MSTAAALLVLAGASLALVGSLGLLRMKTFYERVHPPTMGTTLGTGCALLASMLVSSALLGRPVLHEVLLTLFLVITTPITAILLTRAAIYRGGARSTGVNEPAKPRADDQARADG